MMALPGPSQDLSVTINNTTSGVYSFLGTTDGGQPIDGGRIAFALGTPSAPTNYGGFVALSQSLYVNGVLSGFTPGATYRFWGQMHNAAGYGPVGPYVDRTFHNVPAAPNAPTLVSKTQSSITCTFTQNWNGGKPILATQLAWSETAIVSDYGAENAMTIPNLKPGVLYRIWARVRNQYGWSALSPVLYVTTRYGAYYKDGTTWKPAIGWVREGGIWKRAVIHQRVSGSWTQTL